MADDTASDDTASDDTASDDTASDDTASDRNDESSSEVAVSGRPEAVAPWGWFDDWVERWPGFGRRFPEPFERRWPMSATESIKVEQFADGDQLVIRAELPGVDPEEAIEVSVVGDKLTISATREEREETKTDQGSRSEFHYGSFRREVTLPAGTAPEDVKATYEDGILEVRIPNDEAGAQRRKVPVSRKG